MTKRYNSLLVLLCIAGCVVLSACETTAVIATSARAVPLERIIQMPQVNQSGEVAQMTVTRDAGLSGSGPSVLLRIDKQEIAYFRTEETLTISLPAGEHFVSVVPSPAFGASPREYDVNLMAGAKKRYRISMTMGGVLFQRTD